MNESFYKSIQIGVTNHAIARFQKRFSKDDLTPTQAAQAIRHCVSSPQPRIRVIISRGEVLTIYRKSKKNQLTPDGLESSRSIRQCKRFRCQCPSRGNRVRHQLPARKGNWL